MKVRGDLDYEKGSRVRGEGKEWVGEWVGEMFGWDGLVGWG